MKHRISQLDGMDNTTDTEVAEKVALLIENISEDTDTRTETQPLANSTMNTYGAVKSEKDKSVQTESDIDLLI